MQFHKKNGQNFNTDIAWPISKSDEILRIRLILEELGEFASAFHEQDEIKTIDGLVDLAYVIVGSCVTVGHQCTDCFLDKVLVPQMSEEERAEQLVLVMDAVMMFIWRLTEGDTVEFIEATETAIRTIAILVKRLGWGFEECFDEVHRSNMTKTLGGAKNGKKYGTTKAKGETFSPANLEQFRPI